MASTSANRLDVQRAQGLLNGGATVREVAVALGVSTQAIYHRLNTGALSRPAGQAA